MKTKAKKRDQVCDHACDQRESAVESCLRALVEARGGWCPKWTSPGNAGVPDRIVMLPGGRLAFVEVKRPGGRPRPLQVRQLERLRALGFRAEVVDSRKAVEDLLHAL